MPGCTRCSAALSSTVREVRRVDEDDNTTNLIVTAGLGVSLVIAVLFIANLIGAIHVFG